MIRILVLVALCALAAAGVWTFRGYLAASPSQPPKPERPKSATPAESTPEPEDRVEQARKRREGALKTLCKSRNLSYPPNVLFFRAIKQEQVIEVWAGKDTKVLQLLKTYPLTAFSGQLGPKRREGDYQIPEGVYHIDRFNPRSSFHLSMGLNYPNEADRLFADPAMPGSDIYIHGRAASVGCLAIGDEAIEELYILASSVAKRAKQPIPVHIFPARMDDPSWQPGEATEDTTNPRLLTFWENLRSIYTAFEHSRSLPDVTVDSAGLYQLRKSKQ